MECLTRQRMSHDRILKSINDLHAFPVGVKNNPDDLALLFLTLSINTFQKNIAIKVTNLARFYFFFVSSRVLNSDTRQLFEKSTFSEKMPGLDTLISFVRQRCKVLENVKGNPPICNNLVKSGTDNRPPKVTLAAVITTDSSLTNCLYSNNEFNPIYHCFAFKKLSADKRTEFVTSKRLCLSCLNDFHMVTSCPLKSTCAQCGKQHTPLHCKQKSVNSRNMVDKSSEV